MWAWNLFIAVRILQGAMAAISNLAVIICVLKFPYLRTPSNILITGLASSDFLHGLLYLLVFPIRNFYGGWPAFKYICLTLICSETILVYAQFSMYSLLAMERHAVLTAQLGKGKRWGLVKTVVLMTFCCVAIMTWVVAMGVITADIQEGDDCNAVLFFPKVYIVVAVGIFIVTTFITSIFYARIACLAMGSQRRIANAALNTAQIVSQQTDIRISKMIGMVVGVFFVLYCPFFFTGLALSLAPSETMLFVFRCSILLYDATYWINPFIYAKRDKGFRKAFGGLFEKMKCKRRLNQIQVAPYEGNAANNVPVEPYRMFSVSTHQSRTGTAEPMVVTSFTD